MIIYHVNSENLTVDNSGTEFGGMFGVNGLTAVSLNTALSGFSIDYISSS